MASFELFEEKFVSAKAVKFFCVFSRFEYALKRLSYLINNKAKPNWDAYAESRDGGVFEEIKREIGTNILFSHPPKKQIIKEGKLGWQDFDPPQNLTALLLGVCRVRNNLFHGAKYPDRPIEEPGRNEALMDACLRVLAVLLDADKNLNEVFWNP